MRGEEHEKAKRHRPPGAKRITKLEAAVRQLRAAILLYFSNGDEVAIHTLAFAAHEILRQLAKARGIQVGLDGETIEKIGKGDRKSTRLNSSHLGISYAVFCLKKK